MATRISCKMIPAVETQLAESRIGDIGSVPAVLVEVLSGETVIPCVGLVDTGADISILDEKILEGFRDGLQLFGRSLATGFSKKQIVIYHIGLRIRGESKRQSLTFDNVPVTVTDLHRPLLIIGRRGVLDRLKVELDFPRNRIVLTRPVRSKTKYPNLAREFPSFESIMEAVEERRLTQAILQLSWEMEQFLDRMISMMTDNEILRKVHEEKSLQRRTLYDKFNLVYGHIGFGDVDQAIRKIVEVRNQAAHGVVFETPDKVSVESLLAAAEAVVSSLMQMGLTQAGTQPGGAPDRR